VGGEFAEANGFGVRGRRHGPRVDVGYMDFAETQMLAYLYAETLRGSGFRVRVTPVGGLRPEAVSALRRGRIDLFVGYDGSLLRYLIGTSASALKAGLTRTLARIGAVPMRVSRAQDRNVFVMKAGVAAQLGVVKLSDLRRYWPTVPS
jgi:osmoprotectant transport system substrate-binding protein